MIVMCPSRGRPQKAIEMWRSFRETASMPTTELVLVVDRDDPTIDEYRFPFVVTLEPNETGGVVKATNSAVARFWDRDEIIGWVGDDSRFRTPGWDRLVTEALVTPGIAYGDDLWKGAQLPSAVFISSEIPRALGWYVLPSCRHLFIDNAWKVMGERLGNLHYLPEVVIEHLHPDAGKADWDDMYRTYNSNEVFDHDRRAFEAWPIEADLERVRAALA